MSSESAQAPKKHAIQTRAVHAGKLQPPIRDAITTPLFTSSTYLLGEPDVFDDIRYIRLNNTPNQQMVGSKLAALEGAQDALVTPSGTAAISMVLLSQLGAGDHLIVQWDVYGGTRKLLDDFLARCGIHATYVSMADPDSWVKALRPNTRMFYTDSLTNPDLDVPPLDAVVRFAREHDLLTAIDNTLPSPLNYRPIEQHGYDIVIHSCSKYLNGHTDVVAGVIAGSEQRICQIRHLINQAGVCLDPHACYLLQRGLKTFPLRLAAQNNNARALASMLARHPKVDRVRYPGLPEDPSHERARTYFADFGAIVSFVPRGGPQEAQRLMQRLELAEIAPSFGGVETLVCRPATTTYAGMSDDELARLGVSAAMVRVSCGIEHEDDLLDDFRRALGGDSYL